MTSGRTRTDGARAGGAATLVAWSAAAVAALVVLLRLPIPGTPPPLGPDALVRWIERCGAVVAALALLRWFAVGLSAYLLATTVLGLVARASRIPGLVRASDVITLPAWRRLVARATGVGLVASLALPAITPVALGRVGSARPAVAAEVAPSPSTPPTLRGLPHDEPVAAPPRDPTGDAPTLRSVAPPPEPDPEIWIIEPGDHLWRVSAETLRRRNGTEASDAEVAGYLRTLIAANDDVLAVPGDADLVFPGQRFHLPPGDQ